MLAALDDGPLRYHEIRRTVEGISDKMLAATLRTLVDDHLLSREVGPGNPPRVDYALTELGRGVVTAIEPLLTWIREHADEITG